MSLPDATHGLLTGTVTTDKGTLTVHSDKTGVSTSTDTDRTGEGTPLTDDSSPSLSDKDAETVDSYRDGDVDSDSDTDADRAGVSGDATYGHPTLRTDRDTGEGQADVDSALGQDQESH